MANSVSEVIQGKPLVTGGILRGTSEATLPTGVASATTGFTALGYASDDGLTETNDRSTDTIKAWGGDVVMVVQSEFNVTYQFTLIQSKNADVLKAVHGDSNVSTAGGETVVSVNAQTLPKVPWVFDMGSGDDRVRVVVPLGQVTTVGDITYSDGGAIGYPVTVQAFPDEDGNNAYKYFGTSDESSGSPS